MNHAVVTSDLGITSARNSRASSDPAYQAYRLLQVGFVVAPIVAGIDKFFHLLVNWDNYLAPVANSAIGGRGHTFMLVVGVIEIIAGIVRRGGLAAGDHCEPATDPAVESVAALRRGAA